MGFQRNTKYYTGTVFEWSLPTGWTCPRALGCLVRVDRKTGKAENLSTDYKCYSASAERFPGVRESRWGNLESQKKSGLPPLPADAYAVRIHPAGDFYSQTYFDDWLEYCARYPDVDFWAYTKSVDFWANRIGTIPANLVLTASIGGRLDALAVQHGLRTATVIRASDPRALSGPVDTSDDLARVHGPSFYLINNSDQRNAPKRKHNLGDQG
jgi:hypothetical protein